MSLIDRLERTWGGWAHPGLARVVAGGMLLVFGAEFLGIIGREAFLLEADAVLAGQVWRLGSFLFVPASRNPVCFLFETMMLVLAGDALEEEWGTFRFNVFYLLGAVFTLLAAFAAPFFPVGSYFLNLTLFLAFATLFPDYEFLVFFVLPVKAKFLGLLSGAGIVWAVVVLPWALKFAALAAIGNYLLFFGPMFFGGMRQRLGQAARARQAAALAAEPAEARHRCTACGRTERTDPDLEFRYCTCPACGRDGKAFCLPDLARHKGAPGAMADAGDQPRP